MTELHLGPLVDHVHIRVRDLALASAGFHNRSLESPITTPANSGAYALDQDGNNMGAGFHGPARRSAPSVLVEPIQ